MGTNTKLPSEKTAALSAAKKLSVCGTTEPRYCLTSSGCSRTASENEQKMIPSLLSLPLNVVATDTESNTASTATFESSFCSSRGMPSFLNVARISGSTSSRLFSFGFSRGAA